MIEFGEKEKGRKKGYSQFDSFKNQQNAGSFLLAICLYLYVLNHLIIVIRGPVLEICVW